MFRLLAKVQSMKERLVVAALWTGLLAAAWSLPVLDRIAAQAEREKMESGYYYTPQRPAAAYADVAVEQ
ncbi:hypothetical protein [Niveispirillum sp.]|uniref:hypothetical protein n=1 Tax=Niveispirillum sp. TaxID=1917217 RepID=UPI001B72DE0F|nr:hypothetical protein [Niveispirillum sp.]MBP7338793.1 hypothetical protein [Niveispirillum sp.]